jgi:sortase A
LVGHRFTYAGAAVFYNLDKVKSGDQIIVYWHGKAYEYKVFNISQVSPNKASVEAPTNESILTLYTCTPLLTAKDRLVIQAVLENVL